VCVYVYVRLRVYAFNTQRFHVRVCTFFLRGRYMGYWR